jgi:hypothetical protein
VTTTYTPNAKLAVIGEGDLGWDAPLNGNTNAIDALAPVGSLAVTLKELPSASLNVSVAAGSYIAQDGTVATYAGVSSVAIPASTTKYLYLDLTAAGVLTIGASWPTTPHVRLASVAAGATTIATITDARLAFVVCGSRADGANMVLGTATGTKFGTAPAQKLAFYGATPVIQQTLGAKTAAATYGANEQTMLQNIYNLARTLGLGS